MRRAVWGGVIPVLCVSAWVAGCQKPPPPDHPVDTYLQFARASERDPKTAFEMLSKATRDSLSARAKRLSDASKGTIVNDPVLMFFNTAGKPAPIGDVKLVEEKPDEATVQVTAGAAVDQVHMVREDSRWRVDLLNKLPDAGIADVATDGGTP